jgi:hypothetical protein
MLRPNIEGLDAEVFSAAFYLSGRYAATPTMAFVAEIPYARFEGSGVGYAYPYPNYYAYDQYGYYPFPVAVSGSTIGNPYFGFEAKIPAVPIFLEFGGRPPLASEGEFGAEIMGAQADLTRLFAFPEQYASVQFGFNVYEVSPSHLSYRLRVSPLLAIPSKSYLETELFTLYSVQVGYQGKGVRVGMGMAGLALMTEKYPRNLGERSANQLEFHADFLSGSLRPGLDVHVPLGAVAIGVPVVFGTSLTWAP